jgi:predicted TPR repeat methyltransferase
LDLGYGNGKFASECFGAKLKTGLDLSYKSLRKAKGNQICEHVVQADAVHIPVRGNYFAASSAAVLLSI